MAQAGSRDATSIEALASAATDFLLNGPHGDDPVLNFLSPAELAAAFDDVIPLELADELPARSAEELRAAVDLVIRHSVQTSHPRFFNQNFAGPDPIAVVGDWLGAALNTTNATFEAAPVFTLMEGAVLRKLAAVAGIDHDSRFDAPPPGMFAPGGSTATLYAMQLARHRRQPNMVDEGAGSERLVLFVSDAGHYAAVKSAALLGLGRNSVIEVATDDVGVMDVDALRDAIDAARTAGDSPFMVIATAGTTVTSAFDPIDSIADVCQAESLWLHVDGCYGGSALFSAGERHRLAGVERSDSFVWNLHKMMGVTQQCTALLLADPAQLGPCFATGADYIFQPDKLYGEFDSGDKHFQCARRVDSLKLWLLWQARGDAGFEARIDHSVAMANRVRQLVDDSDGEFAFVVRGDFTNVTFLWVPPEFRPFDLAALSEADHAALHALSPVMKSKMQAEGTSLLGFQPVLGINCLRWLFMNDAVGVDDVDAVFAHLGRYGREAWAER
ncbi:MAG: pyridoxal-dependent decarboxylase [Acidimicrobiia bacterium]|nr:pyridoxal-dependent decarboxylase [Acidimicrobiia bacterium]